MENQGNLKPKIGREGEYYADLDEATGLWCVFHTENNKAFSSFASMEDAEADADKRNGLREWNDGGRLHDLN